MENTKNTLYYNGSQEKTNKQTNKYQNYTANILIYTYY